MSKDAADELKKAIDDRMRVMADKTPVSPVFNVNQAVAVKVAITHSLKTLYEGQPDDGFSTALHEALAILQVALDNC